MYRNNNLLVKKVTTRENYKRKSDEQKGGK